MSNFPVVVTAAGAQPTPPAVIRSTLLVGVTKTNPGYTANLPGSMIEDVLSTEVAGVAECDSARVETINSLTPYGANDFLLSELGQIYIGPGSAPAVPTNTSVYVQFNSDPGLVIPVGFTVGDGTYQYVVQDGGIVQSDGFTVLLFCLATVSGSWAIPTGTVTQLVTEAPPEVTLTVTNPVQGVPGLAVGETSEQYRARVLQAGQAVCTGLATTLKTALGLVSGVQQRLVSVRQKTGGWEVIVGGGDIYAVAQAIYDSGVNVAGLVGSTLSVTNITQALDGVVTTDINHGYADGQVVVMTGIVGMTPLNSVPVTIAVVDEKKFSIGVNTSIMPPYVSGGICSPNLRNVTPSISDPPDVYTIPFVLPPLQTVSIAATWNTTASDFVSQAAVAQLAAPALAAYVNAIIVGAPISLILLNSTFVAAVSSVLDASTISDLNFAVSINGVSTAPVGELIFGDPESYFSTSASAMSVTQE